MEHEPTIRDIFWKESHELLERMERALQRVHREPAAAEELRRAIHTLRGAAATADFTSVSEFCHRLETILETFQGGPVSGEFVGMFADARAHIAHLIGTGLVRGPVAPAVQIYGRDLLAQLKRTTPSRRVGIRERAATEHWRAAG